MIKNKDGSNYSLLKPNPIMSAQSFWDNDYKTHNFQWNDVITHRSKRNIEELQDEPEQLPTISSPTRTNAWCLPVIKNETKDDFYGEMRKTLRYGEKFPIEVIVIEASDLILRILTNVDITIDSIVYLAGDKRWWKIEKIESDKIYQCIISEINPSFD